MAATKVSESTNLAGGLNRRSHDAFEQIPHLAREGSGHGVRGFSDRDYKNARVCVQIMQVFANAQNPPLAMHVARKGAFDRRILERGRENFARGLSHSGELIDLA